MAADVGSVQMVIMQRWARKRIQPVRDIVKLYPAMWVWIETA